MEKFTNDAILNIKEFQILYLLDTKDEDAVATLEYLDIYFFVGDLYKKTILHKVFDYIYVKRTGLPKWRIANLCNVSERTLFRLRYDILNCFKACYDEIKRNNFNAN